MKRPPSAGPRVQSSTGWIGSTVSSTSSSDSLALVMYVIKTRGSLGAGCELHASLVSTEPTTGDCDGLDDAAGLGLDCAVADGAAEGLIATAVELGLPVGELGLPVKGVAVERVVPHPASARQTMAIEATPLTPIDRK